MIALSRGEPLANDAPELEKRGVGTQLVERINMGDGGPASPAIGGALDASKIGHRQSRG